MGILLLIGFPPPSGGNRESMGLAAQNRKLTYLMIRSSHLMIFLIRAYV
ncbi:hypothetical protein [Adlercreutzia equolifaciens]|nr:hypothetical protein [Adlercreutzia equolifaciens]